MKVVREQAIDRAAIRGDAGTKPAAQGAGDEIPF